MRLPNYSSMVWLFAHVVVLLIGLIAIIASQTAGLNSFWSTALVGVGGSLFAAGIAGEALFLHVLVSERARNRLEIFARAGLENIFTARSIQIKDEYDVRLRKAKEIDIIGFGLSSLREDYKHEFSNWSRAAKVRILLIDPDYPNVDLSYADQRDKEEGNHSGKTRTDVRSFIETVKSDSGIDSTRFEVKLLRMLPAVNMFRVNNESFWGPYFASSQSRSTPTLLVGEGFFLDRLKQHFNAIWDSTELSVRAFP